MSIDPGLSIVISFAVFAWIFAKKIYPFITWKLDDYVDSVTNKIREAERLKDEAYSDLKNAYVKKDDVENIIKENRKKSEEKIRLLKEENEKLLNMLKERHEASLKIQLEAEFSKQKNILIEKLSDLITEKISEKISDAECEIVTTITKEELKKLH